MPTTDSYGQGTSLISLTDAPSIPKAIADLADGVIPRGVMRFASASARGATITSPQEGMVSYLLDVNRLEQYNGSAWVTPEPSLVSATSGISVRSGFSLNDFYGYRQGRVTVVDIYLARTGSTIQADDGNIIDTECATLPSGWRPTHDTIAGCYDTGVVHGGWVVGTDGICTLRTASNNLSTNANLRMHITWIRST
ncbi:hypothetical protein [Streptomyces ziwulingensis]|uniref:Uncharacterized protein n=1 Tax=Streptomyces ziwulingensis TaxID=1045501 RepID=A0ABP9BUK0_9ACTN